MQTDALKLARQSMKSDQPERLSWGVVELQVTDLDRAVTFWTMSLGLIVREQDTHWVALGTQSKTLFILRSGASLPVSAGYLGMYHLALGVPDQNEFSRLLARLKSLKVPVSPVDHLMSKAIYLSDPDGLEIEIAFETPSRFGRFGDMTQGLIMYDADGCAHSGREALNIKAELSYAQGADLEAPLSDTAYLAHMHFKVSNLDDASSWYEGVGFARNLMLPHFGFADMGAGAAYTHRLAMNIWAGPNLHPAPDNMARLTHYTLHVHDPLVLDNVQGVELSDTGMTGLDPTGTKLTIVPAL